MAKQILLGEEARRKILEGMEIMVDALRPTLGPKGRCAVLEKKFGSPTVINDGVTIAKEIELDDLYKNLGAQLLREVASKTNDVAGVTIAKEIDEEVKMIEKLEKAFSEKYKFEIKNHQILLQIDCL